MSKFIYEMSFPANEYCFFENKKIPRSGGFNKLIFLNYFLMNLLE